jgi:ATP-dependent DNA ligase
MPEYIVQKPIDLTKLTAKARKQLDDIPNFDITPKYDGCCAVLAFDVAGRFHGAFSATGEEVQSMDHIGFYLANNWRLRGVALVGEAWMPNTEFPVINGTFRRQSEQRELRFVPFDAVLWTPGPDNVPVLADARPYRERIEVLLRGYDGSFVLPLTHHTGDLEDATLMAKVWKSEGGRDGAIARDLSAPYAVGRAKFEVVKVKPTLSLDLHCTS